MELNEREYGLSHHIPGGAADVAFTIQYDTLKAMRATIREMHEAFNAAFQKRKPGFLHPSTWLTRNGLDGWTQLDTAQDLVQGTILQLNVLRGEPEEPDDNNQALEEAIGLFTVPVE